MLCQLFFDKSQLFFDKNCQSHGSCLKDLQCFCYANHSALNLQHNYSATNHETLLPCTVHLVGSEALALRDLEAKMLFYPRATLRRHKKHKNTRRPSSGVWTERLAGKQKFASNFHLATQNSLTKELLTQLAANYSTYGQGIQQACSFFVMCNYITLNKIKVLDLLIRIQYLCCVCAAIFCIHNQSLGISSIGKQLKVNNGGMPPKRSFEHFMDETESNIGFVLVDKWCMTKRNWAQHQLTWQNESNVRPGLIHQIFFMAKGSLGSKQLQLQHDYKNF